MLHAKQSTILAALILSVPLSWLNAAIIGTNSPALPLTMERLAALPDSDRERWRDYLRRSEHQARADRQFFFAEMSRHGVTATVSPPAGSGTRGLALNRAYEWYSSAEALRIADIIVSFQTPAGGWSKNLDLTQHRRAPGERFALGGASQIVSAADLDLPSDPDWNYVGTFDNGATTTQLCFLARVVTANSPEKADAFRKSFLRGLEYIFASQYPNGGWPQVWPLQGGYHDAVTFNDGAMTAILELLSDVPEGRQEFAFVPAAARDQAGAGLKHGLACVLGTQIIEGTKRTAWCQQYDAITLRPTSARNYEMPSLSSGESAGIMLFLMRLPVTDSNVVAAVRAAADWFKQTGIRDRTYRRTGDEGYRLVPAPGSGPLWSRYYELESNRPIFGDRDKSIHDTVDEISRERRDGYAWYTSAPAAALKRFEDWNKGQR